MRLKPPVTVDEALDWLEKQAVADWGVEPDPELRKTLTATAEAMAAVSTAEVPEDTEPLLV